MRRLSPDADRRLAVIADWSLAVMLFILPFPHTAALKAGSFFLAFAIVLVRQFAGGRKLVRASGLELPLGLLVGLAVLSAVFAINPSYSFGQLRGELAWALALFYLVVWQAREEGQWRLSGWSVSLSATAVSVYGLYGFLAGSKVKIDLIVGARAVSVFESHGRAAFFVGVITPLVLSMLLHSTKRREIAALAGMFAVNVSFIVITFARGSWLALAAAIAFLAWVKDRRLFAALALFLLLAPAVLPDQVTNRARSMTEWEDVKTPRVLGDRYWIWLSALEMIRDRPLSGWGYGSKSFQRGYPQYIQPSAVGEVFENAHSFYLQEAVELGIIGPPVVLSIFGIILARGLRAAARRTQPVPLAQLRGMIAGVVVFLIYGFTTHRFENETAFLIWFFLASLCAISLDDRGEAWIRS